MNIQDEIQKLNQELAHLPDGYLIYKTIRGNRQPYLQWHEEGKTKSRYIKTDEREQMLVDIARKEDLLREKKRLLAFQRELAESWKKYPGLNRQSGMIFPVGIGIQSFAEIREKKLFYVDKSMFIKEWWDDPDKVTLITRPRRFGKSLNLDMLDCFFSEQYRERKELFDDLQIRNFADMNQLQGCLPVLHLDFSGIKAGSYEGLLYQMTQKVLEQYHRHRFLNMEEWNIDEKWNAEKIGEALYRLCVLLAEKSGKRLLILIDEYDTPVQEAWATSYYNKALEMMRIIFHAILKNNLYLEKALLTGITRISRESLFSDMNNLNVFTVTSQKYASYFGFSEEEVFAALDSQNLQEHKQVKEWYDGFQFGSLRDIYNPWSITNYLQKGRLETYWANTSANTLIGELVSQSAPIMKEQFIQLMNGERIQVQICENITWEDLYRDERLVWGLFLASGYITGQCIDPENSLYQVWITNREVMQIFDRLFLRWFSGSSKGDYRDFLRAMQKGDPAAMSDCLNEIMLETFSYFDVGGTSGNRKTENFYHGFVLGMTASLRNSYLITSNRESGRGRYDVMLIPRRAGNMCVDGKTEKTGTERYAGRADAPDKAVILEFKLCSSGDKSRMEQCAAAALNQIREKEYAAQLHSMGFSEEDIWKYGIAFYERTAMVMMEAAIVT